MAAAAVAAIAVVVAAAVAARSRARSGISERMAPSTSWRAVLPSPSLSTTYRAGIRHRRLGPSGKYVVAFRSPEFSYSVFNLGSVFTIKDLMIIDISDVNNIRDIRNTRTEGASAIYCFQWLADNRFVYMTWGNGNFGDSMFSGSATAGSAGDQLLGRIDKQGSRISAFDVHPDETSMLVSMFSDDGKTLGVWDIYLYKLNGEPIDRVTAINEGYDGLWSTDASHVFFKRGSYAGCAGPGCVTTCSSHSAPSNLRSITLSMAQELDFDKVPCVRNIVWR